MFLTVEITENSAQSEEKVLNYKLFLRDPSRKALLSDFLASYRLVLLSEFHPFTAMWSIGGPRYTLRRNCIEKHFLLLFFFSGTLNIVYHLHCLWYSLSPLFYNMMLLVKTFKTKKLMTVRTEGFYFLCCRIAHFS